VASQAVVELVVDATGAEAEVNSQLRDIVNDAERRAPTVQLNVTFDQSRIGREFGILGTRIDNALGEVDQNIRTGFVNLSGDLQTLTRQMQEQAVRLERSFDSIANSLDDIGRAADNNLGEVERSADDADRETSRLGESLGSIGGSLPGIARTAAGIGAIASVGSTAVPIVAGLAQALASVAPAAAAGVTGFVALRAAALTLKVGLEGVSEAVTAVFSPDADPAALAEAMERLSPAAREFVSQLREMAPALDELRLDIQERLFTGLGEELQRTAQVLMPDVTRTATEMGSSFNRMAVQVAAAAREVAADGTLGNALDSGTNAMRELESVPADVVRAIARIAEAGGPLLERFAARLADAASSVSDRLAASAESGGLQDAVNNAGDALAQLGSIASNVFGTLSNVFGVANTAGGGLFTTLERITQAMEDATATQEFQGALTALIGVGQTLANNILPLVAEAFRILGPVIEELAPHVEEFVNTLGTELLATLPQLGPIFLNLAEVVGSLLDAFGPILEVIFQLVREALPVLNPLLEALNDIIIAVTPAIQDMAQSIGGELAPLMVELAPVITDLLRVLGPLIAIFIQVVATVLGSVIPALLQYSQAIVTVIGWVRQLAEGAFRQVLLPALRIVAALFRGDFSGAVRAAGDVLQGLIDRTLLVFARMVSSARTGISQVAQSLASGAANAVRRVIQAFSGLPSRVAEIVSSAVEEISSVLSRIGSIALDSGRALINGFASGIRSAAGDAISAASGVISDVRDLFPFSPAKKGPLSGRGYTTFSGQKMMLDFAKGAASARGAVQRAIRGVLREPNLTISGQTPTVEAAGQSVAGLFSSTFTRTAPNVNVFLGNELVRNFVRVEVNENNLQRDREAAQGLRF
jgi:phage-related protein